jgi:hypothetical protein
MAAANIGKKGLLPKLPIGYISMVSIPYSHFSDESDSLFKFVPIYKCIDTYFFSLSTYKTQGIILYD